MNNYTYSDDKNLDSGPRFLNDYTADEFAVLEEKWKAEENRLKNADICGFNDNLEAALVKLPGADLPQEQLEALQDGAKKYRFNQRKAIEREAQKKSANTATVEIYADMIKVKTPTNGPVKGGGERQECKGFSVNSRR